MAKSLHKKNRLTIRFTEEQARNLARAARFESERRGEIVDESTLARELIKAGLEPILAAADQPQLAAS